MTETSIKTIADFQNSEEYKKLTKPQQAVADLIIENLDSGELWKKGWRTCGLPQSWKGGSYHGQNQLLLWCVAMKRGYGDDRWITFNAMNKQGWRFKTDENGKSLGNKAGVPVELFVDYDYKTHKPYSPSTTANMSQDERTKYIEKYVFPVRRTYFVFNCSLVDGIPAQEKQSMNSSIGTEERADRLLEAWSKEQCRIEYGHAEAAYIPTKDYIKCPNRTDFYSNDEFYQTVFHEIIHSTYDSKRLNIECSVDHNSKQYAHEELVAEIGSLFVIQGLGMDLDISTAENSTAYIDCWKQSITDNPNWLIDAVKAAVKSSKYVLNFESKISGETQPFAIDAKPVMESDFA